MSYATYIPATLVGASFLFNVVVGVFGMNHMSRRQTAAVLAVGLLLTGSTVWISLQQVWDSNGETARGDRSDKLLRAIAVANGIDPDQTIEEVASQTLKKKLGSESVQLSNQIFAFIKDDGLFDVEIPRPDHWREDVQGEEEVDNGKMRKYDELFSAKVLSLADRIKKTGIFPDLNKEMLYFENPTNPLGVREVANSLGRMGHTLLEDVPGN